MLSRWNSEPDLPSRKPKEKDKAQGNWIQRHLSFKKKKRNVLVSNESEDSETPSPESPLRDDKRTSSSPILITTCDDSPQEESNTPVYRRPSCIDNVVTVNIIPAKLKNRMAGGGGANTAGDKKNFQALQEEPLEPPTILETDFDKENQSIDKG